MAREWLEAQLKLKYETNCSQMASHNVINTKNITAYGSELHCRGCKEAGTCQADRPNFEAAHTHTHNADSAQKPRPKYIWQPCRFLSSTYVLPFLPSFSLSLLTFYCCTADIIWTVLFVRLSACGIVCFKGVSGVWLNKLGQRCVWEFGICHVALTTTTTWL